MKHSKASRFTFMRNLQKLTEIVETKITGAIRDAIALVFVGWMEGDTYYLAVFRRIQKGFQIQAREGSSWARSTWWWEFSQRTGTFGIHRVRAYRILKVTEKRMCINRWQLCNESGSCQVCENKISKLQSTGFVSHRFSLAAEDLLEAFKPVLDKVNDLMKKLQNLLPDARLRSIMPLKAKTAPVTRWSSTYAIIWRYPQLNSTSGNWATTK